MTVSELTWPPCSAVSFVRSQEIRDALSRERDNLFVGEQPVNVDVVTTDANGTTVHQLESDKEIQDCFQSINLTDKDDSEVTERESRDSVRATFSFLQPAYGWSELLITFDGMMAILSALQVFPQILPYLRAFGKKPFQRDEVFSGFDHVREYGTDGALICLESCYMLKYVQKQEPEAQGTAAWSIRHCLVNQKTSLAQRTSNHILIRISETMSSRLEDVLLGDRDVAQEFVSDWTKLHLLLIESVEPGFREYTNCLDEDINGLFDRVILSETQPAKLREFDTSEQSSRDMKTLQHLADLARRLAAMIELNIDTIEQMVRMAERVEAISLGTQVTEISRFREGLERCKSRHKYALKNISVLVERANALTQQLFHTITLRNTEINRLNAEETKKHTAATLELSEKSSYEAHVVKVLTVLALMFAPASFVADFLQMGYVNIQDTGFDVSSTAGLKLYFAISVPLMTLTMIMYMLFEGRKRKSIKAREKASQSISV